MSVKLAPQPRQQYVDANGNPYAGAKLFYYAAGTTTKQNTYTTSVGDAANTNPVILDASGRTPYGVWLTEGVNYKEVLAPATDTDPPTSPIFTEDVLTGVNDNSDAASQWVSSGVTPTYVSATQFSVLGDKTSTFLVDRRVKIVETAGTVYGYISASAYTTLTTVTVVLDSGTLDTGISSVQVGILTDLNSAIPSTITRNTTAQTLTNKSLQDSTTFIIDNADTTKKVQFQVSGIATGTTRTITIPDKDFTPAAIATNTFTGLQTLSGASLIDANATLAAHATTAAVWLLGNYVTLTGGATVFTDVADAPQAGAEVELYCNAAHTFTNNANLIVDGATDFVAAIGDRVLLRAKSTSVFTVQPIRLSGVPIIPPGSSGNVLTSNGTTWASAAPPLNAMTLLSTVTASSSATVDLETTFSSIYDAYMIVCSGVRVATDAASLRVRQKIGGSYITTSTYIYAQVAINSSSAAYFSDNGSVASPTTSINVTYNTGNAADRSINLTLWVASPTSTALEKTMYWIGSGVNASGEAQTSQGAGHNTGTAALTGIRFFASSGNIASGTFRLYGIQNS